LLFFQELQAGNNGIRAISPEVLNNLPQLSLLDLRDNRVEQLPEEIGLLQALERLDLTNNSLSRCIIKVL
jgi:Leucine-rich repeat (LRR) protein